LFARAQQTYDPRVFATLTLRDGRMLEYASLGDPGGAPVLFFHGTPATGGQGVVVADAARAHGVRLIAPSRPGYGASSLNSPGLALTAADTLELADQLGLERFALMGGSGGGPFSLAVAAAAPDQVTAISVHASPGSCAAVKPEVLGDDDRRALDLVAAGEVEEAMRVMDALVDADLGGLRGLAGEEFSQAMRRMGPSGESWLDRHLELKQAFEADFQRAIAASAGMSRDNLSWLGDWDFDLGSVSTHVRLVYGESDRMVDVAHGEWLRANLPNSELRVIPGEHGAVTFGAAEEFFDTIASA
jgi:pimeloyl-ACP methyl ester carboxylesterase